MKFLLYLALLILQIKYIESTGPPTFLFRPPGPYSEGDEVEVDIKGYFPESTCTIDQGASNPDIALSGATSWTALQSGTTVTLTMSIVSDGLAEPLETIPLTFACPTSYIKTIEKSFDISASSGASGDPHFSLFVEDQNDFKLKQICFDVTSSFYKKILIFREIYQNISVYGILKDDYYMHEIIFGFFENNLRVTLDGLYFNNYKYLDWNSNMQTIPIGNGIVKIKVKQNTMRISVYKKGNNFEKKLFTVEKLQNSMIGEYLNIIISMDNQIKQAEGLIGIVSRKSYEFFDSVQNINANGQSTMKINNRLVSSRIVNRNNLNCWLINVEDAIYPQKLQDFLMEE